MVPSVAACILPARMRSYAPLLVAVASCSSDGNMGPPGATLVIDAPATTVTVSRTLQLTAAVHDAQGTLVPGQRISWQSSDSDVASVDSAGLVTGVSLGQTTIAARSGSARATVDITANLTVSPAGQFTAIAAKVFVACAIETGGSAYCWGDNSSAQLGRGTADNDPHGAPAALSGGHAFTTISIGFDHACGLTTAGQAYCWGVDDFGQLGVDPATVPSCASLSGSVCLTTPVALPGPLRFTHITAGLQHTCGLTDSGAVYCWGINVNGQLGTGAAGQPSFEPVAVSGGRAYSGVWTIEYASCATTADGTAWCWGRNRNGSLGAASTAFSSSVPVRVAGADRFVAIDGWFHHGCGLTTAATMSCWGLNYVGELGNGATTPLETANSTPTPVAGDLHFVQSSSGAFNSCGVSTTGKIYCWGEANSGALAADSTAFPTCSEGTPPLSCSDVPYPVLTSTTFAAVAVGQSFACGLSVDGDVYCWGYNVKGQVGDGTTVNTSTPTLVQLAGTGTLHHLPVPRPSSSGRAYPKQ